MEVGEIIIASRRKPYVRTRCLGPYAGIIETGDRWMVRYRNGVVVVEKRNGTKRKA